MSQGSPAPNDETRTREEHVRPDTKALAPADTIGRFRILHPIGEGGMGAVYAAYDAKLDRQVAVKVLRGAAQGTAIQRLLREAQALARLQHPNVVAVHDTGVDRGRVFIAMEFVRGKDLKSWTTAHPPGEEGRFGTVMRMLIEAGQGLAAAHRAGLVHRDVKPHNILCGDDGRVRMVDFGLARAGDTASPDTAPDLAAVRVEERLTRTGTAVGTPAYMPPEQFTGKEIDARADIFAFCVTAWEAIFGRRPFAGGTATIVLDAIKEGTFSAVPRGVGAPSWVEATLRKGLAWRPGARYQELGELLTVWETQLGPDAARTRGRTRRTAAGVAALAVIAGGVIGYRELDRQAALHACEQEGAAIADAWPGRRDAVRAGLLATELPFAETTVEKITPWLDAWAQGWMEARRDVCVRATVTETLDPTVAAHARACLDLQRANVESILDPLQTADAELAIGAVARAASAPDPAECLDPIRLAATTWPDDDRLAEVLAIRRRAQGLDAAAVAGDRTAFATAEALVEDARAVGFEPLVTEMKLTQGTVLSEHDATRSEALLREAYFDAVRLDLPLVAAKAATRLEQVVVDEAGRPAAALKWAEHAERWLQRLGETDGLHGALLEINRARSYIIRAEYKEAQRRYERALAIREANLGADHPSVASSLTSVGVALAHQGLYADARQRFEAALAIAKTAYGEEHPRVVNILAMIANTLHYEGDSAAAIPIHQRVLRLHERTYGTEHKRVATALLRLGMTLSSVGDHDEAIAVLERAHRIQKRLVGATHPNAVAALHNLGATLTQAERNEEALRIHREVEALYVELYGEDHPEVAAALQNQAQTLLQLQRPAEALTALERAATIIEKTHGPNTPRHTAVLEALTEAHDLESQTKKPGR